MTHGRFDTPPEKMKISASGDLVEACGPLLWDGNAPGDGGPAQKVTVTHVDIKQQGSGAHAKSYPNQASRRPMEDWMVPEIPCQGPKRFEEGLAKAFAEAEIELDDRQVRRERWPEEGTIQVELGR
jgi:hypothetical protein